MIPNVDSVFVYATSSKIEAKVGVIRHEEHNRWDNRGRPDPWWCWEYLRRALVVVVSVLENRHRPQGTIANIAKTIPWL